MKIIDRIAEVLGYTNRLIASSAIDPRFCEADVLLSRFDGGVEVWYKEACRLKVWIHAADQEGLYANIGIDLSCEMSDEHINLWDSKARELEDKSVREVYCEMLRLALWVAADLEGSGAMGFVGSDNRPIDIESLIGSYAAKVVPNLCKVAEFRDLLFMNSGEATDKFLRDLRANIVEEISRRAAKFKEDR